jgi:hypothetical protein
MESFEAGSCGFKRAGQRHLIFPFFDCRTFPLARPGRWPNKKRQKKLTLLTLV